MSTSHNARLIIESGIPDSGPISLKKGTTTFGKSEESDVIVDNIFISRKHCQIRHQDESFYISDLGSKNGTFVNQVRLDPSVEHELNNNDAVTLAEDQVFFRFRIGTSDMTETRPRIVLGLRVEPGPRHVYIDGKLLDPPLSRKEFDVAAILYKNRGNAVSRDDIALAGWPERGDGDVGNQEIEQCIRRLRRRIESDPAKPRYVQTVRGYGFKMP